MMSILKRRCILHLAGGKLDEIAGSGVLLGFWRGVLTTCYLLAFEFDLRFYDNPDLEYHEDTECHAC
jgi:hypothetical protein